MNYDGNLIFSEMGERIGPPLISKLLFRAWEYPELITLGAGLTDNKKLPIGLIQKAVKEIKSHPGEPVCLQYGTTEGREGLREALATHLAGLESGETHYYHPENFMLTNGSQQSLYLAVQVLCDPGDIIFVEGPTYFVFLESLKGRGVDARTMPMLDEGGIDFFEVDKVLSQLKQAGRLGKVKAFYLVSYFSNPSSHSMPEEDKKTLGKIIKKHGMRSVYYRRCCLPRNVVQGALPISKYSRYQRTWGYS